MSVVADSGILNERHDMNLKDARALITGGSEGIGLGIASALKAKGSRVAIMGRNEDKLNRAAKELGVLALQGDVSREADVKRVVAEFIKALGGIDILVNNAGVGYFAPLTELDKKNWTVRHERDGAMLMAREVAPHFIAQRKAICQHLVDERPQRRQEQHGLQRFEVRIAGNERVLAGRTAAPQRARDARQSE
jgi:NAD(P)-dependent dehydrogenase (short-subunit alcohol dehydrogenase family)